MYTTYVEYVGIENMWGATLNNTCVCCFQMLSV